MDGAVVWLRPPEWHAAIWWNYPDITYLYKQLLFVKTLYRRTVVENNCLHLLEVLVLNLSI